MEKIEFPKSEHGIKKNLKQKIRSLIESAMNMEPLTF